MENQPVNIASAEDYRKDRGIKPAYGKRLDDYSFRIKSPVPVRGVPVSFPEKKIPAVG